MTRLFETADVPRPIAEAFAYTADFGHIEQWDPGVASAVRLTPGPPRVGSTYRLEVVFGLTTTVMDYRIVRLDAPNRVVLEGAGGSVHAVDDIRFTPSPTGTRIDYAAELTFRGSAALAEPFLRPALERAGRKAVEGLRRALAGTPAVEDAPSALTTVGDRLLLPGLAQFTRAGYWWRRGDFAALAVSMAGRTVVITGATSGLGRAAADSLARLGARVVLVGRDREKLDCAREEIERSTGNANLAVEVADLSLLADTRALARRLLAREARLHVLINNAAVLEQTPRLTAEGIETSLATNLLSPFVLTTTLLPRLRASAPARIVNVLSGGMYLAGLGPEVFGQNDATWDGATAYARHKRALMVLTETWAGALDAREVTVNAMHPGWAETPGVARSLPLFLRVTRPLLRTPAQGADTIVWLAAAPELARTSGGFFLDRARHPAAVLPRTAGSADERAWLLDRLRRLTAISPVA